MNKTTWFYVSPPSLEGMMKAMEDRRPVQIDPPNSRAGIWYIVSIEEESAGKFVANLVEADPKDYQWIC